MFPTLKAARKLVVIMFHDYITMWVRYKIMCIIIVFRVILSLRNFLMHSSLYVHLEGKVESKVIRILDCERPMNSAF